MGIGWPKGNPHDLQGSGVEMPIVNMACEQCSTPFRAMSWPAHPRRFCSRPCLYKSTEMVPDISYIEANSIPEPNSGCWLWLRAVGGDGYGLLGLKARVAKRAHRASWVAYYGDIPSGLLVRHRCDNRICVNPKHLELGTNAQNVDDMVRRKRQCVGTSISTAVLTESDVVNIRAAAARGVKGADLARQYNMGADNISRIINRKIWKHV